MRRESSIRPSARYVVARLLCTTIAHLREAVATLEDVEGIARRVFGNAHPDVLDVGKDVQESREALARLGEDSDKAAMMALAFVAALAFLAGRRYLRR